MFRINIISDRAELVRSLARLNVGDLHQIAKSLDIAVYPSDTQSDVIDRIASHQMSNRSSVHLLAKLGGAPKSPLIRQVEFVGAVAGILGLACAIASLVIAVMG